jgi:hypothetical protein
MNLAPCSDILSLRYLFDDLSIRALGLLRSPNRAGKSDKAGVEKAFHEKKPSQRHI